MTTITRQQRKMIEKSVGFKIDSNKLYEGNDISLYQDLINQVAYECQMNFLENDIPFLPGSGTKYSTTETYQQLTEAIGSIVLLRYGYCAYGWLTGMPKIIYKASLEYIFKFMEEHKKQIIIKAYKNN